MVESPICPLGKVLFWRGAIFRGEDGPRHLLRLLGFWCFILWVCTYKMETSPVNSAASGFMDTLVSVQQPAGLRVPSPLRQLQQPWGSLMPRCPQILNSQRKLRQGCPFCPPRWRDTAQPGTCCLVPRQLESPLPAQLGTCGQSHFSSSPEVRKQLEEGDEALAGWIPLWLNAVWGHSIWHWPQCAFGVLAEMLWEMREGMIKYRG